MRNASNSARFVRPEPDNGRLKSPYSGLEERAFWRTAVAGRAPGEFDDIYRPKFPITRKMKVMTAGSSFA